VSSLSGTKQRDVLSHITPTHPPPHIVFFILFWEPKKGKLGRHLEDESPEESPDAAPEERNDEAPVESPDEARDCDKEVVTIIKKSKEQLVADHAKWLACSGAFYIGETCSKRQRFVPEGYFFETGRQLVINTNDTTCADVTAANSVPEVKCRIKRGLTMVLPVHTQLCFSAALDDEGNVLEEPEPLNICYLQMVEGLELDGTDSIKATLDGKPLDTTTIILSPDKDVVALVKTEAEDCPDGYYPEYNHFYGYPITAGGPYVFLDTSDLDLGEHELVLIGGPESKSCVSGVKHTFELTRR
jgi:hypothetical protein